MAYPDTPRTRITYAGAGSQGPFSVPFPYLRKSHVLVYKVNTLLVSGTDYTWTTDNTLTLSVPAPVVGETLSIVRQTPLDSLLAVFSGATSLDPTDLDTVNRQFQYAVQEALDLKFVVKGDKGDTGLQGVKPYTMPMVWATGTTYTAGSNAVPTSLVTYAGSSYVCVVDHVAGATFDVTKFIQLVSKGDQGIQGIQGIQGVKTFGNPAPWAASTAYTAGNATTPASAVVSGGSLYFCTTSHTSGGAFDASKFQLLASKGDQGVQGVKPFLLPVAWAASTTYTAGDAYTPAQSVLYNNNYYACITSHTSTGSFDPSKWVYIAGIGPQGVQGVQGVKPYPTPVSWAASTTYTQGDAYTPASAVTYQGSAYVCTTSHTSTGSFDASKFQLLVAQGPQGLQGSQVFVVPVAWAASTAYTQGDAYTPASAVTYQGSAYVCTTSHTSTGSFDASKFVLLVSKGDQGVQGIQGVKPFNTPAPWAASTAYTAGTSTTPASAVVYNGSTYACTTSHTSTSTFDASKFQLIVSGYPFTPVQQGTGVGQATTTDVKLGVDSATGLKLLATLGSTDLGQLWSSGVVGQSLASNGYIKLPNGLIIQWTLSQTSSGTWTFPTAFPNACACVVGTAAGVLRSVAISPVSTSSATVALNNTNNGTNVTGETVRMIAIGY